MQGQSIQSAAKREWSWPYWPLVPLYPYGQRRTLRTEVVKDTIWTFDQLQGIFYVVTPIRMTVVKLEAGGLLVYAPIAPTRECVQLVNELVNLHGNIKYIILPTASGLEHKVFVAPFARQFPTAQIWTVPHQWSFPLNLPLTWLGFPGDRTYSLPSASGQTPFGTEFDYAILGPINLGLGSFEEVALFHRRSRTLILTDTLVSVPEVPPKIVQLDAYPLLFHAKESAEDEVEDTAMNRQKGWHRIVLFSFYFQPSALEIRKWGPTFQSALKASDRSRKAYFGLFPFRWLPDWQRSLDTLRGNGRPFVAPILQALILNRAPRETLDWANRVAAWGFEQIIPCHFDAPIAVTPTQFRQAFAFLERNSTQDALPEPDFALLRSLNDRLDRSGITPPAQEKV